jgi:hypothetical protein
MPRGFLGFALGSALLLGLAGCGGGSGGGPTVKGKVLSNGQPVAGAEVVLESSTGKGNPKQYFARTDDAGNFEIKAFGKNSVQPGTYAVLISLWLDKKTKKVPSAEDFEQLKAAGQLYNDLPSKYSDPAFAEFKAEIKDGENTVGPFDVGGKGKGK